MKRDSFHAASARGAAEQEEIVSKVYGLPSQYQARCVAALAAVTEETKFLLGTLSLREDNEVQVITYKEEEIDIRCERVYKHPYEIWSLAPSAKQLPLLFTCYNDIKRALRARFV